MKKVETLFADKLVCVRWEDSRNPRRTWIYEDDLDDSDSICICYTVGFLIKDSKKEIMIAQSISDIDSDPKQINGIMAIAKSCILDIRQFRMLSGYVYKRSTNAKKKPTKRN